jgi:nucleoside phosphorylase
MESHAFVHTALALQIPRMVIKAPTDYLHRPGGHKAFRDNLPKAAEASGRAVAAYLQSLDVLA